MKTHRGNMRGRDKDAKHFGDFRGSSQRMNMENTGKGEKRGKTMERTGEKSQIFESQTKGIPSFSIKKIALPSFTIVLPLNDVNTGKSW